MKILLETEKPELCAAVYGVAVFVIGLLFGAGFVGSAISALVSGALALVYFLLLDRFRYTTAFWVVFVVGLVIGVV